MFVALNSHRKCVALPDFERTKYVYFKQDITDIHIFRLSWCFGTSLIYLKRISFCTSAVLLACIA